MTFTNRILTFAAALLLVVGCAKANRGGVDGGADDGGGDSGCGTSCDQDGDGVVDAIDQCADSSSLSTVNRVGCSDSQLTPMLEPVFPPFGLTWVPTGDLGMAGGLTWTYTGIERGELFHIDWIICDDPTTPCGLSLDGPIDMPAENWLFNAAGSDLPAGRIVFTSSTRIRLADTTTPALSGRLTLTIVDVNDAPIPFAPVAAMDVTPRLGTHGADIPGTGFKVVALGEVQDATAVWTPYTDYYNAAPTPVPGGELFTSYGGSFYSE